MRKFFLGFTVIELLLVFAVVGILSVVSIASFSNFNNNQVLQLAAEDVYTMLTIAKSRSISQVKPPVLCSTSDVLKGYEVTVQGNTYSMKVACGEIKPLIESKRIPASIGFASPITVFFAVGTGNVPARYVVAINGYGKSKTITVNETSTISIEDAFNLPITPTITPIPTSTPIPTLTPTATPIPTSTPTPTPTLMPEPEAECGDNADNDGDGGIDYPNDSECVSGIDNSEALEGQQ